MKKTLALILAMCMAFSLCACGQKTAPAVVETSPVAEATTETVDEEVAPEEAEAAPPEEATGVTVQLTPFDQIPCDTSKDANRDAYDIGLMFCDMANEYWVNTASGVEARCAERNCNYNVSSSNNTSSEDIRLIENYINAGMDAVIAGFYSTEAAEDVSKQCIDAGIPLLSYCFGNKNHSSEIVSDNYADGGKISQVAADYITKTPSLAEKDEIVVAFGTITSVESMKVRCDGMKAKFLELVPNAKVVDIEKNLDSTAKAYDWMEEVLLVEPNVDIVLGFCDAISIGAAEALKDAGYTGDQVAVFGMDGSASACACIAEENGVFKATVAYDTFEMGKGLVDIAIAILDGDEVASEYEYITPTIIDSNNVAQFYSA